MEYVERAEPRREPIPIARCRELLGEDAESMTDQDIEDIRRHAENDGMLLRHRWCIGISDVPNFDGRDRRRDSESLASEEMFDKPATTNLN
jgi:hypothetical protein